MSVRIKERGGHEWKVKNNSLAQMKAKLMKFRHSFGFNLPKWHFRFSKSGSNVGPVGAYHCTTASQL